MQTDPSRAQEPLHVKVEDGVVIGRWSYHDDVKFTDAEIAQLDGPLPKIVYLDVTGGRTTTTAFVELSAETATVALKAVAERADKLCTTYMRADKNHDLAEIERVESLAENDDQEERHHFTVRLLTDDPEAVSEFVCRRPRALGPFATAWPRYNRISKDSHGR